MITYPRSLPILVEEDEADLIDLNPDDVLVPRSSEHTVHLIIPFLITDALVVFASASYSDSPRPIICAAAVLLGKSKTFHHS